MDESYDVIIVGASISGLCMSNYLAKKGLKILLIDLKNIKKLGEGASAKILSEESVLFLKNAFNIRIPAKFIMKEVSSTSIGSINHVSIDVNNKYYLINNKALATYLIGKIIDLENVDILERHMITGIIEEDRTFTGLNIKNLARGGDSIIKAKIFVDASGSTAALRRILPNNRFINNDIEDFDRAVIYEEVLEYDEDVKKPKFYFDPSKINSGYVWVVPEGKGLISVGMGVSGKKGNDKKLFTEYKNLLIDSTKARLITSGSGIVPLRRPLNSFVYRNVVLIGSSACQVNPLVSRDISFRLKGAYYASKAILSALKGNMINTETLWSYNINYMRDFGWKSATLECVRDFFASLSTETFDFILENNIIPAALIESLQSSLKKRSLLFNNLKLVFKPRLFHKFAKLCDYSKNMKVLYDNYPEYDGFEAWKKKLNHELNSIRKSFLV